MFVQEGGPWVVIWVVTSPLKLAWREGPKSGVEEDARVEEEVYCRPDLIFVAEERGYVGNYSGFAQWAQE
jgi:hypothetical protein